MTVDAVLHSTRYLLRLSPRTTCRARRTGNESRGPVCGDGEKACLMHSFLLLEKADKRLLRRHDCLCLWPHPLSSVTLSPQQTEPLRGETSQTALTSKGLATALQTRPQQVGTARSPLKMDFNPGHGEPGSQRVGVKPQRGSTAVAPPAPCSCLSCWPG